jgi:radical SAM protein with 4Fe4S-binding SPASM domain
VIGRQVIEALESGRRPLDNRFSSRIFQLLTKTDRNRYCDAGITGFGITPDGIVLGCILLDAVKNRLGHIDDKPSVWRSAGARWVRTAKRLPKCDDCSALSLCGGGCPAINPICGESECEIVRKNCDVAKAIYDHFRSRPEALLGLAGVF